MGEEGGGRSCGITRDLQKLKQQAMAYYQENDVPRRLEELLNSTFYLQPADVYGHLVGTCGELPPPPLPPPPPAHAAAARCACAVESRLRAAGAGGLGRCLVTAGRLWSGKLGLAARRDRKLRREGRSESREDTGRPCSWEDCPEPASFFPIQGARQPAFGFLKHRPDAKLTSAAVSDRDWAVTSTATEFLRSQACAPGFACLIHLTLARYPTSQASASEVPFPLGSGFSVLELS